MDIGIPVLTSFLLGIYFFLSMVILCNKIVIILNIKFANLFFSSPI